MSSPAPATTPVPASRQVYHVPRRPSSRAHGSETGDTQAARIHHSRAGIAGVVAPLLLALGALAVRLHVGPLTIDDAFITYRYARNVAEGVGFVYNPGQAVLGTTTPLYTLAMAAMSRLGFTDLPTVSWVLNASLDAATTWLLYLIGRRLIGSVAGVVAAALFAFAPMSIAFSAGGMEGSLFVFLLVASLWAALNGRMKLAIALIALDTLVRPEAVIAAGLVLGMLLARSRRLPLAEGMTYAAVLAPWAIFATWYFGSPIPQSIAAKSVVYSSAYRVEPAINAIALATQAALPAQSLFLFNAYPDLVPALTATMVVVLPFCVALFVVGGRGLIRANGTTIPWVLFPLLYALAYAAAGLRGVRMFHWYLVPLLPFYALCLAAGLHALAQAGWWRRVPALRWAPFVLLALWWAPGLVGTDQLGYPIGFTDVRERLYREVALDYRKVWQPETVIALPEIGAVGYETRSAILDTVGLVSPVAVRYYPIPGEQRHADNAVPPALIHDLRPDYVVTLNQFVVTTLLPDPWFQANYRLVDARDITLWDSTALLVYRRTDLPG